MFTLGIRVLTGILWSCAATLLIVSTLVVTDLGVQHDLTTWFVAACFAASILTGWLVVEHAVARETERSAERLANAVGVVLGERLHGEQRPVTPIRR